MKISDILSEGRTISFADPDHEPGAVEREGAARASAKTTAEAAATNLTAFAKKYKLGEPWIVGKSSSMVGDFVMQDRKDHGEKKKMKLKDGKLVDVTMWPAGRYDDLCFSFYDVDMTKETKTMVKAKAKELMPKIHDYALHLSSDDRKQFTSVTLHLGHPSQFADAKTFAGLKKFMDFIKKEVDFTTKQ